MNTYANKTEENKNQSATDYPKKSDNKSTFQFVDNRPEIIAQRKLQGMAHTSLQTKRVAKLQTLLDNHSAQQQQPVQKKVNKTGLPDNLKSGIESLSGYSMDDVKVHYNSDKPAQLQAHAYAQGTDIHLASGQEKHLSHEAWHVVQQKQGRVKPTIQMKGKVNINDDSNLEKEADTMGAKALQLKAYTEFAQISYAKESSNKTIQRAWQKHPKEDVHLWHEAKDGLAWFYEKDLMKFQIVHEETATKEWLAFYKYYEGQEKSYEEWNTLFEGTTPEKKIDVNDARAAAMHTVGDYKSRNAVISTLTMYNLLANCTADKWSVYSLSNYKDIFSYFKTTYESITKRTLMEDEVEDSWANYFEKALPIIKGFQNLGTGDDEHIGIIVNRGDSEGVLIAMGLYDKLNVLADGTTSPVSWDTKFLGATSTAKGDEPSMNQYAKDASVVWILRIAKGHHGFDFKELIGEGYEGEKEITFPMGVTVKIDSVKTHRTETYAPLRPSGCNKAKYTIYGKIF